MSKDSAAKFVQAVTENEELRERAKNLKVEDAVTFAKEMGYDFTSEELAGIMNDKAELSPEELGSVTGGVVLGGPCSPEDVKKKNKDAYCYGDVNGQKHDYEKVLHGERRKWYIFKSSFDVYRCKRCGHQIEK